MTALLLDQGLPYSAADLLRKRGIDAIHVADLGMGEAADVDILKRARSLGRVVCTLDSDFHALMALADAVKPSVIFIRMQLLKGQAMADLLSRVVSRAGPDLDQGVLISVSQAGLRMR